MNKSELNIELLKLTAVQDYLLTRGSNDEEINSKIRDAQRELLGIEEGKNNLNNTDFSFETGV